jgi:hypothetical protein
MVLGCVVVGGVVLGCVFAGCVVVVLAEVNGRGQLRLVPAGAQTAASPGTVDEHWGDTAVDKKTL